MVFEESSSDSESDGFHALAHRARVRLSKRPRQEIVAYSAVPGEFSSDTESDEVYSLAHRARVKMADREIEESGVVSAHQKVVVSTGRQVIMTPEGIWGCLLYTSPSPRDRG